MSLALPFELAFLVPLFPALGFVLLGLGGRTLGKLHGWIAVAFEGAALATGLWIAIAEATGAGPNIYHDVSFVWLGLPDGTNFVMGTLVSPLGALMLIVVNVVGFLVVLYSNEYMAHEEGLPRYYAELMLFLAAMNGLVLADNYLEFILMWELVGLCSYLLIGFFWKKPSAASAAKKAFIVTRVGDVLFFLGVFILFSSLGHITSAAATTYPGTASTICSSTDPRWSCVGFAFTPPNANSAAPFLSAGSAIQSINFGGSSWLPTLAGLLILGGAAGKSAQFPLHTWLPDAMEGPTTVSALIHAATMVAAGIYLLAITSIFIGFTMTTAMVILAIGAFTSLFAGTMGLASPDIKRVIAYSTVSQLGYMAMAVGASSVLVDLPNSVYANQSGVAMFHLFTHAFFKALLFLSAGSVIHAIGGQQDIFKMGGLRRHLPITSTAMLVGALALSGIPPFAGFFSKDDLIGLTWTAASKAGDPLLYLFFALSVVGIFLTALYIFRLWFLVFSGGAPRDASLLSSSGHGEPSTMGSAAPHADPHAALVSAPSPASPAHGTGPHDPSWIMTAPLLVLSALAMVAGFLPLLPSIHALLPGLSWSVFGECFGSCSATAAGFDQLDAVLGGVSLALAGGGILVAWRVWGDGRVFRIPEGSVLAVPHRILFRKYYFDEVYDAFAVSVVLGVARAADWVDRYVIDGTVRGIEEIFSQVSRSGRRLQSGIVSSYAAWVVVGLLALLLFFVYVVPCLENACHSPFSLGF
ncbi:MAG: NADH-quinone oxidoreductase subunit L [Euryarchaeota archaeon]|nr:NADH-quinone oxidoreductase subunit L [Euryarchaeota archaeon]MDE1835213.1 NADH-quinone oxidoreductase subunit L [Euryarchaeota archaeon]MDE1880070.1 NADH-quinone oxidoreductase subunit L [Euryarchaeota archaeon]MDE2043509.1 NADH-quinone oxidoreductase subunit L [Thermoplasmata archaeon]